MGYYHKGEKVEGHLVLGYIINTPVLVSTGQGLHICYANMDSLVNAAAIIQGRGSSIEIITDARLVGKVTAENGQRMSRRTRRGPQTAV